MFLLVFGYLINELSLSKFPMTVYQIFCQKFRQKFTILFYLQIYSGKPLNHAIFVLKFFFFANLQTFLTINVVLFMFMYHTRK